MTGVIANVPKQQFFDNRGNPAVGYALYTYLAGTTSPATTYQDAALSIANTNPIVLDARGECAIWGDPGKQFKFVLKDSLGAIINTLDNVTTTPAGVPLLTDLANSYDMAKGVALVGGAARVVDSIAALRSLPKTGSTRALVVGYYGTGDGGGGVYWLDLTDTSTADNGGSVIVASDGGRWKLRTSTGVSIQQFGAKMDGTTDDTIAIRNCLTACRYVIIPEGKTTRITSYVNIPDNTHLEIRGAVDCYNKAAGFYTNGGANVTIDGGGIGKLFDSVVQAGYIWNQHQTGPNTTYAPAIHFRNSTNCVARGLVLTYLTIGIWFSNASANSFASPGSVALSGAGCKVGGAYGNYATYIEGAAIQGTVCTRTTFDGNYVYRAGDGGLWMMGCYESNITNNRRESPYGSTNDLQGIEVENCFGGRVAGNTVTGFAHYGIDIKNNCKRLTVEDNEVIDCETGSIVVREGDSVKNPCHQIVIKHNKVKNNGYAHIGAVIANNAAIYAGSVFQVEICDNDIHGYRTGPAIQCTGPGAYLASNYAGNPSQTSAVVDNNRITWKNNGIWGDSAFELETATPTVIYVSGLIDTVSIDGNKIIGDRMLAVDSRINTGVMGIYVVYDGTTTIGSRSVWPVDLSIKKNTVSKFHGGGIRVTGPGAAVDGGVAVSGNNVSYCCAEGIVVENAANPLVSDNRVNACGSGAGHRNILVNNCQRVVACGNSSSPRTLGGTNATTWALSLYNCVNAVALGNNLMTGASGTLETTGSSGVVTTGNI